MKKRGPMKNIKKIRYILLLASITLLLVLTGACGNASHKNVQKETTTIATTTRQVKTTEAETTEETETEKETETETSTEEATETETSTEEETESITSAELAMIDTQPAPEVASEPAAEPAPQADVMPVPEVAPEPAPAPEPETEAPTTIVIPTTTTAPSEISYVLNTKTKKFHLPSCSFLPSENRQDTTKSRDTLINEEYEPCKKCNP